MSEAVREPAGWGELLRSGRAGGLALTAFGVWLHAADELMVSTITPDMVSAIGGREYVAWLTSLYETGSIVSGAAGALLVLRLGIGPAMALAAAIYAAGCLVSALAPAMEAMLLGRLVQGLGGGAMIAVAFVAIHKLLPDRLTARGYALLSVVWGASAFSGPMIGAAFAEAGIWRWSFLFYAAQAAIFCAVALAALPGPDAQPRPPGGRFPWRVLLLGAGVVAVSQAGVAAHAASAALFVAFGFALLALFLALDGRADAQSRMLPLGAWNWSRPAGQVVALVLFLSASTTGLITYGPLLMTRIHGMSAWQAGLVLLLESVGWSVVAIWAAGVADRRERTMIAGGFSLAAAGIALLAIVMASGPPAAIAAGSLMMGGGFGMAFVFMIRRATRLVGEGDRERIASAIPTTQRMGYALGAAFAGIVANASGFGDAGGVDNASRAATAIFATALVPAAIGLAAMALFVRRR